MILYGIKRMENRNMLPEPWEGRERQRRVLRPFGRFGIISPE
jgi:hypothetical protein